MPAARSGQQFCPNCGAKVTKTQRFCRDCGTDLQLDQTEELTEAAPRSRSRAASSRAARPKAPAAPAPPPPSPADLSPPPAPAAAAAQAVPPTAWISAGACGLLVVSVGLSWFGGGFDVDALDIPFTALFSDTAQGGLPLGVVFLVLAGVGLAVALLRPEPRALRMTFIAAGAASTLLMVWYMARLLTSLDGASLFDAFSIGAWLALLSSLAILVGGVLLRGRSSADA